MYVGGARLRRLWGCSSPAFLLTGREEPRLVEDVSGVRAVSLSFGGAGGGGLAELDLDSWKSTVYGRKLAISDGVNAQSCK
jgi:hypothetical protein